MEDWAEIRRLHRGEDMSIKAIARRLRISRNTVRSALAADEPPRYRRESKSSIVDEVEGLVNLILDENEPIILLLALALGPVVAPFRIGKALRELRRLGRLAALARSCG